MKERTHLRIDDAKAFMVFGLLAAIVASTSLLIFTRSH